MTMTHVIKFYYINFLILLWVQTSQRHCHVYVCVNAT